MTLTKSWLCGANDPECDYPLNNLPFGVFSTAGGASRCGVALGDHVVDLAALEGAGLIGGLPTGTFARPDINAFMALGETSWRRVRARLTELFAHGGDDALRADAVRRQNAVFPIADVTLHLPFKVSEYTDFYAGRQHATNVGTMFRGAENALPPNWLHIPIGYNGRASTVVVSGANVQRPFGQTRAPGAEMPSFGPSRRLDIELEMGAVVGVPNEMGCPVTVEQADAMIFGYVLLNDWSARDIQAWEYQPLGPFQAKAFATTISPWVVSRLALEPFRVSTPDRVHPLLPYLNEPRPLNYDVVLEVSLQPAGATHATTISRTNFAHMYYSSAQQLTHHASGGCKMNTGDLLGSGTISGDDASAYGSLLEITWGGERPLVFANGVTRSFLEDGDTVTLTGHAQGAGYRIGFGVCAGTISPGRTCADNASAS